MFKNIYFFDTNMIISNSSNDKRFTKLFTLNSNYFVTEKINEETDNLLRKIGYRKVLKKNLIIINFDDLRQKSPNLCPVYYNFIVQLHNPAVIKSPDFWANRMNATLFLNGSYTEEEKIINNKIMDNLKDFYLKEDLKMNQRKYEKNSSLRFLKKKRMAIKQKESNYFNDLRSFSLMFLYCLEYKKNVTFVTSDSDAVNLFFNLTSGVAQQYVFKTKILSLITKEEKKDIVDGKELTIILNPDEIADETALLLKDIYSDIWKKDSFYFKIKFWSIQDKKYYNYYITFNDTTRLFFLNSHGQYNCPCADNHTMGNWLSIRYWYPPASPKEMDKMKVVVSSKAINYKNSNISNSIHNNNCLYVKKDKSNDLAFFCSFFFEKNSNE